MVSPQVEEGYTRLANELLEALCKHRFPSDSALRILLFIARKTYGYNKKQDRLSFTQLQKATNLSRKTVNKAIKQLVTMGLLVTSGFDQKGTLYGLNKHYNEWVVYPTTLVTKGIPEVVTTGRHTKETIKTPIKKYAAHKKFAATSIHFGGRDEQTIYE